MVKLKYLQDKNVVSKFKFLHVQVLLDYLFFALLEYAHNNLFKLTKILDVLLD